MACCTASTATAITPVATKMPRRAASWRPKPTWVYRSRNTKLNGVTSQPVTVNATATHTMP